MMMSRRSSFRWFLTKSATMHINPVRKVARRQGPAGPNGLLICARIDEGRLWDLLAPGSLQHQYQDSCFEFIRHSPCGIPLVQAREQLG